MSAFASLSTDAAWSVEHFLAFVHILEMVAHLELATLNKASTLYRIIKVHAWPQTLSFISQSKSEKRKHCNNLFAVLAETKGGNCWLPFQHSMSFCWYSENTKWKPKITAAITALNNPLYLKKGSGNMTQVYSPDRYTGRKTQCVFFWWLKFPLNRSMNTQL